jgi:hypothetical protein
VQPGSHNRRDRPCAPRRDTRSDRSSLPEDDTWLRRTDEGDFAEVCPYCYPLEANSRRQRVLPGLEPPREAKVDSRDSGRGFQGRPVLRGPHRGALHRDRSLLCDCVPPTKGQETAEMQHRCTAIVIDYFAACYRDSTCPFLAGTVLLARNGLATFRDAACTTCTDGSRFCTWAPHYVHKQVA